MIDRFTPTAPIRRRWLAGAATVAMLRLGCLVLLAGVPFAEATWAAPIDGADPLETAQRVLEDPRFQTELPQAPEIPTFNFGFLGGIVGTSLIVLSLAAVLLLLIWLAFSALQQRAGDAPPRADAGEVELPSWARGNLPDPDTLGHDERYAEAIHVMLLLALRKRIAVSRVQVGDALTSREVLALLESPPAVQQGLGALVAAVERTWFGDRPADAEAYRDSRIHFDQVMAAGEPR